MRRRTLTEEDARTIMDAGDISADFAGASGRVAVVLTQGWCPQWMAMDSYLARIEAENRDGDLTVFHLVYDRLSFFPAFLRFKETRFANEHIPYVRYYRDGRFVEASNYVGEAVFLSLFGE